MRRRASILLLSVFIGLFITLASGSFLGKKREISKSASSSFLVDDIDQFNNNLFAMKANSYLDTFNQIALEILLTRYNYSAAGFDKTRGPTFILNECFKNPSDDNQEASLYCKLDSYNVDPNYSGYESIKMYLNKSNHYDFDSQNSTMNYYGVPVFIYQSNDSSATTLEKYCSLDASYFFTNSKTKKPFNYSSDQADTLSVKIRLNNGNCSLVLVTPSLTPDLHKNSSGDVIKYTMVMVGIAFVQMIGCGLLIWKLEGNSPLYKRTSLGTLSFLIAFDFFIYLIHFTYWTTISSWMAVTFICFFVVAVFIEPVVLYHVFSAFQRRSNTSIVTLLFTIYFWLVISAGCIIFSLVCFPNFIFYIYPFFLAPQIIDNFMARRRYKFNWWLICGLGLPKLFYIAYLSLDPVDLFDKGFSGTLMIYSVVVLTIEMIVLKVQTKLPTFGYRGKDEQEYNYQCTSEETRLYSNEICSICTEKVSLTPLNGLQIQQPLLEQDESLEAGEIFKTPCRHHFHRECLIEWLRKKLECPNCRQKLPPLPDYLEDDD